MVKLSQAEVLRLPAGEIGPYHVKLIRLHYPIPKLEWEGNSVLYVARAPAYRKLPERLTCITPRAYVWAEGGFEDVQSDGSVVVEDYQMEIYIED